MKMMPTISTPASTAFMSPASSEREVAAEARPGEHGLGQHRAFEQERIGQRDHGDELHEDVAERVPPHAPASASGPSRARR